MKNLINNQIKELYNSKASFCEKNRHSYKDFSKKINTAKSKLNWLNVFLKPLKLTVTITRVDG